MSTFLELCETFHEEIGLSGSISAVTGQTGMLERLVNWIIRADKKVQGLWTNWDFLWAEWELTLVSGIASYAPPSLLGRFDVDSFWIDSGSDDAQKIEYTPYSEFQWKFKHFNFDDGYTDTITVRPDKYVQVSPAPSSSENGKVISVDYWKRPYGMANNSSESPIPAQYHQIIVERAKMFHAAYVHSDGKLAAATVEYSRLLKELEAHSLPGQQEDRTSEAVRPHVIVPV